jgi:RNA methyltransferase, TrmH family
LVRRALAAGLHPLRVLLGASLQASGERPEALLTLLEQRGVEPLWVEDEVLLALGDGRRAALVTAVLELPPPVTWPQLRERVFAQPIGGLLLVLMDVREPGNLGALARTALAAGADGLWCIGSSDPFHPKAIRTSLGSVFRLPIALTHGDAHTVDELAASGLVELAERGVTTVAACAEGGLLLPDYRLPRGHAAVVMGNEGHGLSSVVVGACSARVTIPQSAAVDSFSVSAAAAILLYEIQRQRVLHARA